MYKICSLMKKTIKVGNIDNIHNQVKINDKSVSRNHLEVTKIDNETLFVKDLNSTNGTYINGIEIVESYFRSDQTIKIGHQTYTGFEFFRKVAPHFIERRVIWAKEFKELEPKFMKYEKKKMKINQAYQNKTNILRGFMLIFILMIFFFFGESMGITSEHRIFFSIGGGIIAGILAPKMISKDKINHELFKTKRQYSTLLSCPRCMRDLTSASYKFWREEKRCSYCDAIWVE
jgi:hypothetical protein